MTGEVISSYWQKLKPARLIKKLFRKILFQSWLSLCIDKSFKACLLWRYRSRLIDFLGQSKDEDNKIVSFTQEFHQFKQKSNECDRQIPVLWGDRYPCLDDKTKETGFDRHYIYHPAWAARIIFKKNVKKHIDISSTLTFSTILSAFIPVEFYDYRPANIVLSGLFSNKADLCCLPFEDNSIESISCMHVIEHIGLGRYNDAMDPMGDIKASRELSRVLAVDGTLLIVVPVGVPRIQFNAHRIYSHEHVLNLFCELELQEYSLIPDGEAPNGLLYCPEPYLVNTQKYGCGCYVFTKRQ